MNTSKETTVREITDIEGVPEEVFRLQNMGIAGGHDNAVLYCTTMFKFPNHQEMLELFRNKNKQQC